MSEILSIDFPVEIKKSKTHNFKIEIGNDYVDGEEVELQYPSTVNIKRSALIKPSHYKSVLIVTSAFNVRYTNWTTIIEAKEALRHNDIVANCVTINGKKEYIISRENDNIDDVYLPMVRLTHLGGDQTCTITAQFREEVKGSKKHIFRIELSNDYFDSDKIDSEYDFHKDFDKIALVKSPAYSKVLLITQTLKLMLTDWDTIEEAESMIAYDDLKAYYVHIAGKPVCLIADADQDISGISRRIPIINEITDAFSLPTYIEAGTPYEGLINELNQPTFSEIRNLSVDYVNTHRDKLDTLFDKLNHGVNILKTQDELYAYMYCFGKMHEAKLIKAFDAIPRTFFKANKEIEVIDYACGQGLATLCLNDYIEELYDITIKRITLIDPSKKALSRAALHCHKVIPEAVIDTLLTTFDDLDYGEIPTTKLQRVHLLSNILDMDCYDLGNLADIIQDIVNSGDMFVCVDPWFHDIRLDRRQQRLMRLLSGKKIYHEAFNSGELASNKTWTAYITVFKV